MEGDETSLGSGSYDTAPTSLSSDTDVCKICHCGGETGDPPLITPCLCSGSLKFVHQECLQRWIKSSDIKKCELCKFPFIMQSKVKPFCGWEKLEMTSMERRKLVCSVTFHVIAITCVIWSLYVLIDRTTVEIRTGELAWPFWTKLVVVAIGFTGGLVFMYIQCKVYLQLCKKWKAYNRIIVIQDLPVDILLQRQKAILEARKPGKEYEVVSNSLLCSPRSPRDLLPLPPISGTNSQSFQRSDSLFSGTGSTLLSRTALSSATSRLSRATPSSADTRLSRTDTFPTFSSSTRIFPDVGTLQSNSTFISDDWRFNPALHHGQVDRSDSERRAQSEFVLPSGLAPRSLDLASFSDELQYGDTHNSETYVDEISSLNKNSISGLSSINENTIGGLSSLNENAIGGLSSLNNDTIGGLSPLNENAIGQLSINTAPIPPQGSTYDSGEEIPLGSPTLLLYLEEQLNQPTTLPDHSVLSLPTSYLSSLPDPASYSLPSNSMFSLQDQQENDISVTTISRLLYELEGEGGIPTLPSSIFFQESEVGKRSGSVFNTRRNLQEPLLICDLPGQQSYGVVGVPYYIPSVFSSATPARPTTSNPLQRPPTSSYPSMPTTSIPPTRPPTSNPLAYNPTSRPTTSNPSARFPPNNTLTKQPIADCQSRPATSDPLNRPLKYRHPATHLTSNLQSRTSNSEAWSPSSESMSTPPTFSNTSKPPTVPGLEADEASMDVLQAFRLGTGLSYDTVNATAVPLTAASVDVTTSIAAASVDVTIAADSVRDNPLAAISESAEEALVSN